MSMENLQKEKKKEKNASHYHQIFEGNRLPLEIIASSSKFPIEYFLIFQEPLSRKSINKKAQ